MTKPKVPVIVFRIKLPFNQKNNVHTGMKWPCDDGSTIRIRKIQSIDTSKGYLEIIGTCEEVTK